MLTYSRLVFRALVAMAVIGMIGLLMGRAKGGLEFCILLYGVFGAFTNRRSATLSCFILFPVLLTLNPYVFPMGGLCMPINRISTLVIALVMVACASKSRGRNRLPLGGMVLFLICAAVSSLQGYMPNISYLKIFNFSAFLAGIWLGTRNFQNSAKDLIKLRIFLLGMASFYILGSLATLPFPAVAYFQNTRDLIKEVGVEAANEMFGGTAELGVSFFAGVTNQSQCLGPMLAATVNWVIADMLFVERRAAKFHLLLIVIGIGLLTLTHSRTAMVAFAAGATMQAFYVVWHIRLSERLRRRIRSLVMAGACLLVVAAGVAQIRSGGVTNFLRKGYASRSDMSFLTALTASRQGLIAQNLRDFHYNELLGCGFQVAFYHQYLFAHSKGLILSAPIEKGVIPLMVLGETGVIGFCVFCVFLILFYAGCKRRQLLVTMALFTVLLASNFGEADFFSPGGIGGAKWVICVVGGFIIDTQLLYHRVRMEYLRMLAETQAAEQAFIQQG